MTLVSNDPSWWPSINSYRIASYFVVAASAGMIYDWVLTFGQEVELVWRQRWSLMTALYLTARYAGILFVVCNILFSIPTITMTDAGCLILYSALNWICVIVNAILGVIMIARLYAMNQRSVKALIPLVVIFLTAIIFDGVTGAIAMTKISGEEFILSGAYQCTIDSEGDVVLLHSIAWILATVWEVLALCLAVWIAVKHFRELRQHSEGGIIGDYFTVLLTTHVVYFASFVAVSCFKLGYLSPAISTDTMSQGTEIYNGLLQIDWVVQMFVLGPRLILGVRQYHAKLVADSDAATGMTSIFFQERVHVSTRSDV